MNAYKISEHYDPSGIITAESDPAEEFAQWEEFAMADPDWDGDEFTEQDFADYIDGLKEGVVR